MKSQEQHDRDRKEKADPKALATARELALMIPNDAVMLFGSRARGDHRTDSDMDILLLSDTARRASSSRISKKQGNRPQPRSMERTHTQRYRW